MALLGVSNDYEFKNAVTKWTQAITGDVPDFAGKLPGKSNCGAWPDFVDDLYMCGRYIYIDGPGGVLGAAGPRHYRPSVGIPITGEMQFDSADVNRMDLLGVIVSTVHWVIYVCLCQPHGVQSLL